MLRCLLAIFVALIPTRALAQEGEALCSMAGAVESLSNTPGRLDSQIATGTVSARPPSLQVTTDPAESYIILAAVDHGAAPRIAIAGCGHDVGEQETSGTHAALDFGGCHAGTITITLTAPRGRKYAFALWRLDRAQRDELGIRPQGMVVGGTAFGMGFGPSLPPGHLPACIRLRTERATTPPRNTAPAPSP